MVHVTWHMSRGQGVLTGMEGEIRDFLPFLVTYGTSSRPIKFNTPRAGFQRRKYLPCPPTLLNPEFLLLDNLPFSAVNPFGSSVPVRDSEFLSSNVDVLVSRLRQSYSFPLSDPLPPYRPALRLSLVPFLSQHVDFSRVFHPPP